MDWSRLHTLHLAHPSKDALDRLRGPTLPSLKHLSIKSGTGWGATQVEILDFVISGTGNLHSISLQNMGAEYVNRFLQSLLASPNLTQALRHFSFNAGGENLIFLNQTRLSLLLAESQKIEHLDINLPRDFNMSMEGEGLLTDILSTLTLKHLTIRLPSPDQHFERKMWDKELEYQYAEMRQKYMKVRDKGDEKDPLINYDKVTKLFDDMRARKNGVELEELEFYVGDWDNRFERGMFSNLILGVAYWKCSVREGCRGRQTRVIE